MSERIDNEDGYISHVVLGSTSDNKMFRTEFHTSDNSGLKLPDTYKGAKYVSSLSTDRYRVVISICNFLVYVRALIKSSNAHSYKKVVISVDSGNEFTICVRAFTSNSSLFEAVNEKLPKNYRNKVYFCALRPTDTWFQVCIY